MTTHLRSLLRGLLAAILIVSAPSSSPAQVANAFAPPGQRPLPPGVHAIQVARLHTSPTEVLEPGTVLIRNGRIEAVGKDLPVPADARLWTYTNATLYPGFIELYAATPGEPRPISNLGTQPILTSGAAPFLGVPGDETDPGQPGPNASLSTLRPEFRVATQFSPDKKALENLRALGFTAANFIPTNGILRGTSALAGLREATPSEILYKSDTFQHASFDAEGSGDRRFPASLMGVIAAMRQLFYDAQALAAGSPSASPHDLSLLALRSVLRGERALVIETGSTLMVQRADQMANEFNLRWIGLSNGQEWRRPDLITKTHRMIVPFLFPEAPKFTHSDDWDSLTLDQLRAWDWAPENAALLRQRGATLALTTYSLGDKKSFRSNLALALARGLSTNDALAALTLWPAEWAGMADLIGSIAPGKLANFTLVEKDGYFTPENKVLSVWVDGVHQPVEVPAALSADPVVMDTKKKPESASAKSDQPTRAKRDAVSPLAGRGPSLLTDKVLLRGATLWTSGPQGILTNGVMRIEQGKIQSIGTNLPTPSSLEGWTVIQMTNQHITPGLIDAHNHSMIVGSVNEGTLPSTAMVRIGDVVNSETENIWLQLAGGVTTANLLHGSANPIGGQNCVIKLRDGAHPDDLKMKEAPIGIKFALGENVKQANWGEKNATRFPQTRLGVRTFFANRFIAARQYGTAKKVAQQKGEPPPRRDLELETLLEILEGKRWIHCHSYRQDEIVVFLRLMEEFGIKVGTLQHVLEGYKVADEIAAHGAGGSCFSDWWAYKFEVWDAIPYAGSLMRDRGVVVSFNSDSSDLARRMNTEASKAIKYGDTPPEEALKFVTLNPAKQLRIDALVGSLEVGKQADLAIWSHSPLSTQAICEQTWIEGKRYFDLERSSAKKKSLAEEYTRLLTKAKALARDKPGDPPPDPKAQAAFFIQSWEHRYDTTERHCDDE